MGERKETQIQILKVIGWFLYVDFFLLFSNIFFFTSIYREKPYLLVVFVADSSEWNIFLSLFSSRSSALTSILNIWRGSSLELEASLSKSKIFLASENPFKMFLLALCYFLLTIYEILFHFFELIQFLVKWLFVLFFDFIVSVVILLM